jgi:hypothetical protein
MRKGVFSRCSFLFFVAVLALGMAASPLGAQNPAKGNLIGHVFDRDGSTPVAGAVIKLRNISSAAIYDAPATDKTGFFRLDGLAKGIYNFGITTTAGDFNSNELVGIIDNETTKIAISLSTYEGEIRQSMQEITREQSVKDNEARVGRVVQYLPATKEAVVYIEKGALQVDDRIRVRGITTNFYQDVDLMGLEGVRVKRALAGQNPFVKIIRDAQVGDGVYVICKNGVAPFFLTPCGIATVVGAALAGIITIDEKPAVSPFKK